jgi:hypothetical protein
LKLRNAANNAWITLRELDGTLTIEAGTVSAPGLAFASDLNTGVFSAGADQLAIATNGVERVEWGTSEVVFNDGGANYDFRIEGDTNANLFFVDASADAVGLGSSSPLYKLQIEGSSSTVYSGSARNTLLGIYNPDTTSGVYAGIELHVAGVGNASLANISAIDAGSGSTNLAFGLRNSGTFEEKVRITSAGLVGIGTTAPTANLELGTVASANQSLRINSSGNNYLELSTAGATGEHKITAGNSASGTAQLIFETASGGTESERARIDSSGRLLVGTSTSLNADSLIQAHKSSGSVFIRVDSDSLADNQEVGFFAVGGSRAATLGVFKHSGITNPAPYLSLDEEDGGVAYYWTDNSGQFRISSTAAHIGTTSGTVVGTQTSDERLKNILGPVTYGLDTLKQIEPVRYSLKSQPDIEQLGFIAQQVQPLVPQSVFDTNEHIDGEPEDAPTKLGMEYVALIPVLVNAIKELSAEVDALKAKLQAL